MSLYIFFFWFMILPTGFILLVFSLSPDKKGLFKYSIGILFISIIIAVYSSINMDTIKDEYKQLKTEQSN